MMPSDPGDFYATHHQLPPPGGYVSSLPGPPCGDCGATAFEVAHCYREARQDDGAMRHWESIDVQCPGCAARGALVTARTLRGRDGKRVIGAYDTVSGRLTIH